MLVRSTLVRNLYRLLLPCRKASGTWHPHPGPLSLIIVPRFLGGIMTLVLKFLGRIAVSPALASALASALALAPAPALDLTIYKPPPL